MGNHVEKQTFSASMRVFTVGFEDRMKVLEANAPRSQSDPGGRSIDAECVAQVPRRPQHLRPTPQRRMPSERKGQGRGLWHLESGHRGDIFVSIYIYISIS